MLLRESTDMQSPLAVNRFAPGRRISLLGTASGRVYLAFCGDDQRETLLDVLSRSQDPGEMPTQDRATIHRELAEIRAAGYATHQRAQRVTQQCALAVPVLGNGRVLASLSIRYAGSAVRRSIALQRFLPRLEQAAMEIGRAFEAGAPSGAP
jgi:IclR family mhp operon transcriptional activator